MLLSKTCEYGLRAMLHLAAEARGEYVSLGDISERLGISFTFLGKIFQTLSERELTKSRRGPHGGVALARGPDSITLYEIVAALDGEDVFRQCVLGLPGCGEQTPCPMHHSWVHQRDQLELLFRRATLDEMAAETREREYRLSAVESSAGDEADEMAAEP